jgi:hypothetical protein
LKAIDPSNATGQTGLIERHQFGFVFAQPAACDRSVAVESFISSANRLICGPGGRTCVFALVLLGRWAYASLSGWLLRLGAVCGSDKIFGRRNKEQLGLQVAR